jgi:hypothetical protein
MTIKKQVPLHGRRAFVSADDDLVGRNTVATGGEDKPSIILPGSIDTVALFDDFLGDLVGDEWAVAEGDTGLSSALTSASGGVFRLTGSETQTANSPAEVNALTQGLFKNWKPDAGKGSMKNPRRLRMVARVKFDSVSRVAEGGRAHVFVGLSDSGGAEMPAYDTGAGILSNAADLMGFLFSPGGDTGWTCVSAKSVAGDSGDQAVVAGASYGPSANTYTTLELDFHSGLSDTGGSVSFYIDGKPVGRISSPVASNVALTPWIGAFAQDTGYAPTIDVDLVNLANTRDTGF